MFLIDAALAEAAVWQQRIPITLGVGQVGHAPLRSEIFPPLFLLPLWFSVFSQTRLLHGSMVEFVSCWKVPNAKMPQGLFNLVKRD